MNGKSIIYLRIYLNAQRAIGINFFLKHQRVMFVSLNLID